MPIKPEAPRKRLGRPDEGWSRRVFHAVILAERARDRAPTCFIRFGGITSRSGVLPDGPASIRVVTNGTIKPTGAFTSTKYVRISLPPALRDVARIASAAASRWSLAQPLRAKSDVPMMRDVSSESLNRPPLSPHCVWGLPYLRLLWSGGTVVIWRTVSMLRRASAEGLIADCRRRRCRWRWCLLGSRVASDGARFKHLVYCARS